MQSADAFLCFCLIFNTVCCQKMNSFNGERALWLTLSKSEVAVCPGSQQASECQAEQGKDDSREANPLK